jgi:hypothetical protein
VANNTMNVKGVEELKKKLGGLDAAALKSVRPRLEEIALLVEGEAKKNCTPGRSPYDGMVFPTKVAKNPQATGAPFDMGQLRGSIRGEVLETRYGAGKAALKATISAATGYADKVHNGTSKMQARPYLTDAIAAKTSKINEVLAKTEVKG